MIYGFVKQSGGHVTIYSEEGKGTTVNLYLPRVRADAERDAGGEPREATAAVTGETILLVEDHAEVRSVAARRLRNLGYAVVEAENATRAIEQLGTGEDIDLVFSDVVMPGGMSGFDLARWVREHRADSAGPVDVGLCRGHCPCRRDAGPGRGSPAQALFRAPTSRAPCARREIGVREHSYDAREPANCWRQPSERHKAAGSRRKHCSAEVDRFVPKSNRGIAPLHSAIVHFVGHSYC